MGRGWSANIAATNALGQRAAVALAQGGKEKDSRRRMQQNIRHVMHAALHPEQRVNQEVREQGQGSPVAGNYRGEGPFDAVERQAGLDMGIWINA